MICLSLTASTLAEDLALLEKHTTRIDIAELRIDLLSPGQESGIGPFLMQASSLRESGAMQVIGTVRRTSDGGAFGQSEAQRMGLLDRVISLGFTHVDLESDLRENKAGMVVAERARDAGCRIIRSVHDPVSQPVDLASLLRDLSDGGKEIAKLAVTPGSTADLLKILEAADETPGIEKILIGMGPYGVPSRILSRRFGSLLTYVSDPGAVQAAPGHIGPEQIQSLYRFREISPRTRLFGVIGSPIDHSRSPEYHNRRFAEDQIDARYLPFLVDDVTAFFGLAKRLPVSGFSVTIPHKQSVLPFLAAVDGGTTAAGSCNTVVPGEMPGVSGREKQWRGVNTDLPGFLAPLREEVGDNLGGRGATVIGAGGAARAIVLALLEAGLRVLVINRSADRANHLVTDINAFASGDNNVRQGALSTGALSESTNLEDHRDLIVQTTSLGMHGRGDPAPWMTFLGTEVIFDIVYTPPETPFILRGRAAGCLTITGDRMFAAQAEAQYQLFSRLAVS